VLYIKFYILKGFIIGFAKGNMVPPLIDVHAHLTDSSFTDIEQVLNRAKSKGVERIIISTTGLGEFAKALELLGLYPDCISLTIGFDPAILSTYEYRMFYGLISQHSFTMVGIGEVGLDHYYVKDHAERELQESFFRTTICLARSMGLPLVIHSRSAGRHALEVLYSEGADRVLMHAFDGKVGDAIEAVKEGYFFSIPTSVVYSEQKQKLARLLPLEHLMLETDSPVLAPLRGERNEPANLICSAEKIAELKRISVEDVATITTENAKRFFNL
jgi:TatD DNase family protein